MRVVKAAREFDAACTDIQDRPTTPEEVDDGCEPGVFFYDCGACPSCQLRTALAALGD
jgi:hypothetical protein